MRLAAGVEASNPGVRFINQLIKREALPHRFIEGIKGMRRKQDYKELVACLSEGAGSNGHNLEQEALMTPVPLPTTSGEGNTTTTTPDQILPEESDDNPPVPDHRGRIQDALEHLSERLGLEVPQTGADLYNKLEEWCPSVTNQRNTSTVVANNNGTARVTSEALSRRRATKALFRVVQKSYRLDRTRTIRDLLGSKRQGAKVQYPEGTREFWRGQVTRPSPVDDRRPDAVRGQLWGAISPITEEEIASTLTSTRARTTPGPDGRTSVAIRQMGTLKLAWLFNGMLNMGETPGPLAQARTVLIPKVPTPNRPEDLRPIAISSVATRVFHRILARRVAALAPLPMAQKGFSPEEGTVSNLLLLQTIIKRAQKRFTNLQVCFVDFRKAFDSVGHPSILQASRRWGFPAELVDYVGQFYARASTSILGDTVDVTRGVLQGDPLSPTLFNVTLDWVLSSLPEEVGVEYGGQSLRYLAFADDVALFASTPAGMRKALAKLVSSARGVGLEVGIPKCASLSLLGSKKHKKWVVDQSVHYEIDGIPIQAMGPTHLYRYLGLQVGAGVIGMPTDTLAAFISDLEKLQKAPLKPQQKLWSAQTIVSNRYRYPLVLGKATKWMLQRLDREMRKFLRRALHLPGDTPVSFFHASAGDGGLGVFSHTTGIPLLKDAVRARLTNSPDPLVRHAVAEEAPPPQQPTITRSRQVKRRWAQSLHQTIDGAGLSEAATSPVSSSWIQDGTGLLTGSRFIQALKVRGNLIHTRLRSSRGRPAAPTRCDKGCNQRESLGHILQSCPSVQPWRIKRHDDVLSLFIKILGKRGWRTCREPAIPTPAGIRRPDLIIWGHGRSMVVDVQVVSDSGAVMLLTAHESKVAYYQTEPIDNWVLLKTGARPSFSSLTFNWRGIMASASVRTLKDLGLTRQELKLLTVRSLEGSVNIVHAFADTPGGLRWRG
ncbi:MAG: reverse transcriptase family protein [Gammaproteobacteria bacterium]|nr:reverse transcriptase family protein [Gammaproteobacteria bacterium]